VLEDIIDRGNLRRAFDRVRENHGCRGADGMTVGQLDLWTYLELKAG
jgi:hypothetical protein